MPKDQKGFHVVAVLLIILVLGVLVFAGFMVFKKNGNTPNPDLRGPNYRALRPCGKDPVLTTLPMDLSRVEQIAPLGGVNTPDHTLPTDHMYIMYPYGTSDQKDIFAPANITVTAVSYGSTYVNGALENADYRIDVYPCRELKIIFGHIDTLSSKIAAKADPNKPGTRCHTSKQGDKEIRNCDWAVDITLSAGELLGTSNGWDLWATYEGYRSPNVISPKYYHNVDAVCPLDYFTDNLKSQMYALMRRTAEPKCGEAYQDKAGTLQGGWFAHKDPEKSKTDWSSHFSLTHHSTDANIAMVAVAGTLTNDDFIYRFTPRHSGTINREPSETVAGTIYCYQHEGDQRTPNGVIAGTGKVLLKLRNDHEMQIEHKEGSCTDNESFSHPATYYR